MIEVFGFDLDGTLYDDRQYIYSGFVESARLIRSKYSIDILPDLVEEYFENKNYKNVFDVVVSKNSLPEGIIPKLIEKYHENDGALTPYPDIYPILERLAQSYKVVLISDGKNGHQKVERLGLNNYFDHILITPNHGTSKSERAPFSLMADYLNTDFEEMIYVGDNPYVDFHWPQRLGMSTVWVRRPSILHGSGDLWTEPEYCINSLWELEKTVLV